MIYWAIYGTSNLFWIIAGSIGVGAAFGVTAVVTYYAIKLWLCGRQGKKKKESDDNGRIVEGFTSDGT